MTTGISEAYRYQDEEHSLYAPAVPRSPSLIVRTVDKEDLPSVRNLIKKQHSQSVFGHLAFSESRYDALERKACEPLADQCVFVAESRGEVVGVAWVSQGKYLLSDSGLLTTTHVIAVDTDRCAPFLAAKVFINLVRTIVGWSRERDSRQVLVHVTTGTAIKGTDRLLRASGARVIGGGYVLNT